MIIVTGGTGFIGSCIVAKLDELNIHDVYIVDWLGCEDKWKNIARRVKKTYWLNTEPYIKWDTGDSIASVYWKYCQMYEAINTNEILAFLSNMK